MFDYSIISLASAMGPISAALESAMFLLGFWFSWKAVMGFTNQTNDKPHQGESPWSNLFWGGIFAISGPVIGTAITTMNGGVATGDTNPFAYVPSGATSGTKAYMKDVIVGVLTILKFFGYWFMLKGFLLLKEITDGAHGQKQHNPSFAGFTHIVFSAILILACDRNSPIGVFLGINTVTAAAVAPLGERVTAAMVAIREPMLLGFALAGTLFGAFYTYSGIRSMSSRSSGGQQKGSISDDLKKIFGGGALAGMGGVAGMSAETMNRIFS